MIKKTSYIILAILIITIASVNAIPTLYFGGLSGSGTSGTLTMWNGTKTITSSDFKIFYEPDETYFSGFDGLLYLDKTNYVAGINVLAGEESHEATFSVNTQWRAGTGTLTADTYDSLTNTTQFSLSIASALPESLSYSTRIRDSTMTPPNYMFIIDMINTTTFSVRGDWNGFSTSNWSFEPSAYIDVNGGVHEERGYSISSDGKWKWAMYVPDNSNNSKLCFQSNQFLNSLCLDAEGNAIFSGNLKAETNTLHLYAGFNTYQNMTDNLDGSITIPTETASFYSLNDLQTIYTLKVTGGTTGIELDALANQAVNYIYADYNGGSPQFVINTDAYYADYTSIIPYATVTREDNIIVILKWGETGNALAEKIDQRLTYTRLFEREDGLALSAGNNRTIILSSGHVWHNSLRTFLDDFDSINSAMNATHNSYGATIFDLYMHINGVWTEQRANQYLIGAYDNGTEVLNTTGNYTVNWIYRTVADTRYVHAVLDKQPYTTLENAIASQPRNDIPDELKRNSLLVGRIINYDSNDTPVDVGSAFLIPFTTTAVTNHNDLAGLQGGNGAYYHLSFADHSLVHNQVWNNINTTNNILSLGFNTTNQLDNLYYPKDSNPSGYLTTFTESDPIFNANNASIFSTINLKLNITDANQYNETARIDIINSTKASTGTCPSGTYIQNATSTGVQCIQDPDLAFQSYYGEIGNATSGATLALTTNGNWYNVTGLSAGLNNGFFILNPTTITCNQSGIYQISYTIVGSVNGNDVISSQIIVNNVAQTKTLTTKLHTSGAINTLSSATLINLTRGDNITMQIRDSSANTRTYTFTNRQLNIID